MWQTRFDWGTVYSLSLHQGAFRTFVHHLKEFGSQRICREAAGHCAILRARVGVNSFGLVPVPASNIRSRFRGHRPVEQVGHWLSQSWKLSYLPQLLRLVHHDVEQKRLNHRQRREDTRLDFRVQRHLGPSVSHATGKELVLFDDVLTSGETLRRAHRTLQQAGYRVGLIFTLATANEQSVEVQN